jgi:hypothetical protein
MHLNDQSNESPAAAILALVFWLTVVGAIVYTAFHFIVKYWP